MEIFRNFRDYVRFFIYFTKYEKTLLWFIFLMAVCTVKSEPVSSFDRTHNIRNSAPISNDTPKEDQRTLVEKSQENAPNRLAILDKILQKYDKRAWPTYGVDDTPTKVEVNIYINSLGSVNAANMEYSMDIYLRQSWLDRRLDMTRFGVNETLTLSGDEIPKLIWKPDLFFRNVKQASFHFVTVPNMLIKLSPGGRVLYSMRLTLRLSCHMTFRTYPLDTQRCHVILGAYAQTTDQMIIGWKPVDGIIIDKKVEVPEFNIVRYDYKNFTRSIDTGSFSFLNVTFILQRQNGYHLVQTYLPTFLIVMISWVSFWLHVDASPARVTLGVTTLLTLTTLASGVRTQLPPVSYVKAIDVWIGACSVMVFGALLEFALVNFLSRTKCKPKEILRTLTLGICQPTTWVPKHGDNQNGVSVADSSGKNVKSTAHVPSHLRRAKAVDRASRILFPAVFIGFNFVYWSYYLNDAA